MPKIVIQVAKFDKPAKDAQGRTFAAKVYDTTGNKYTVPKNQPHLAGMFHNSEGNWFEIYAEDKVYNGNPYKEIVTANPTTPITRDSLGKMPSPPPLPTVMPVAQVDRNMVIWCNAAQNKAVEMGKVDPWNEDACVELGEIQKRVYGRLFLGEEAQEAPATNSGQRFGPGEKLVSPQAAVHPRTADELDDEVPF